MKRINLEVLLEDIEELYDWVEELHNEVRKLKQGGSGVFSKNSTRPGSYMSIIEELYGRDIEFDGSESGIKMTPWDALMDITEEEDDSCSCDFCGEEDSERNIVIPVIEDVDGWEADAWNIYANLYKILVSKQKDYGPDNIRKSPGGPLNGLTVRLYDKLARLNNLLETGATPENESLRDTFLDIANYGVIGMMILDDTFPKSKDN